MTQNPETNEEVKPFGEQAKQFLEDNLRLIVSIVFIVAVIIGLYAYSQRTQEVVLENATEEQTASQTGSEKPADENTLSSQGTTGTTSSASTVTSQETEGSYIETAVAGNGTTHLARRALADHLQNVPDSELTPAHKIYIEDYLRKHIDYKGSVKVGTKVEFSKTLIDEAIQQSKTLNERQLSNLDKYAQRVPSLR